MSKILPKLNLNKTPQAVDDNSLIMAKYIRLLKDNSIVADTSVHEIEQRHLPITYVASIWAPAHYNTTYANFDAAFLNYDGRI